MCVAGLGNIASVNGRQYNTDRVTNMLTQVIKNLEEMQNEHGTIRHILMNTMCI